MISDECYHVTRGKSNLCSCEERQQFLEELVSLQVRRIVELEARLHNKEVRYFPLPDPPETDQ